jgi:hypothetical protein
VLWRRIPKPVHVDSLPFFENMATRCPRCRSNGDIWLVFCRNCAEVGGGEHYHGECEACGQRWVEQTREVPAEPSR